MSHISGETVQALMSLTEVKASDDVAVCLEFDNSEKAVRIIKDNGEPLTLGDLRQLAAAFGCWL